ncbi:MAG: hypothetical protein DRO94_00625 [Candidatus Altiarchaeales archaeon]|nr:MAG: hypothetical protein DRO95_01400 [Candidatus Altiarchaeales archaeon]RLI95419.1 MAG: hypothetical protein DRO94_00625 [Candidatus Altiarchaeales archaeon]
MTLYKILLESVVLLLKRPKLFVPRLITTFLYSLYTLFIARFTIDVINFNLHENFFGFVMPRISAMLLAVIILYFIDIVSYAMYPALLRDYKMGKKIELIKAFKESISLWRLLLVMGVITFVFIFIIMAILSLFIFLTIILNNPYLLIIPGFIAVIGILIFVILMFFVIPIAVIENKGPIQSIRESICLGLRYKGDLLKVNLFFLVLICVSFIVIIMTEMNISDMVSISAIILFIVARVFQAIIYTYICVANPYLYLVRK